MSNTIPKNIKHLYFGDNFNKSVNKLPTSIKYLYFGHNFNQRADMLPTPIKYLKYCVFQTEHIILVKIMQIMSIL